MLTNTNKEKKEVKTENITITFEQRMKMRGWDKVIFSKG